MSLKKMSNYGKEPKLVMNLEHQKLPKFMTLVADDLHELIEKLKEWNDWEENVGSPDALLRQTKRFKADPEGEEKVERESGWYYFKELDKSN